MQKYLNDEEKLNLEKSNYKSLTKILAKIYRTFEKFNSAGVTLIKVFDVSKRNLDFAFKMFFVNLDIWGSLKENSACLRSESQIQAEFARITIERWVTTMKNEKGKLFENVRFHSTILLNWFSKLSKYLSERNKIAKYNSTSNILKKPEDNINKISKKFSFGKLESDIVDNENMLQEDKFETIDLRNSKVVNSNITEENKMETIRNHKIYHDLQQNSLFGIPNESNKIDHSYFRTAHDPKPELKGHLLLLRWGHNGNFNIQEKSEYEKYLLNAGFIRNFIRYDDA